MSTAPVPKGFLGDIAVLDGSDLLKDMAAQALDGLIKSKKIRENYIRYALDTAIKLQDGKKVKPPLCTRISSWFRR